MPHEQVDHFERYITLSTHLNAFNRILYRRFQIVIDVLYRLSNLFHVYETVVWQWNEIVIRRIIYPVGVAVIHDSYLYQLRAVANAPSANVYLESRFLVTLTMD